MADTVVCFLEGLTTDGRGRQITEILDQDDWFWENTHDFIQWLFPLKEESSALRNSPILNEQAIEIIRASESAQGSPLASADRYKTFLLNTTRRRNSYDHDHLRITRVIKSLRLLTDDETANGFKYWVAGQLGDQIDSINARSKKFWRLA
ncbi:opioid growth factor receptor-related protein [Litorivicinus sp.]|nr:opioid growth factor receptor-related protein [Litorivicinus sp.]